MNERLIYALRDPRTEHFRYVGLSTRGMKRPQEHLQVVPSRARTHCAKWLRKLKADDLQPIIQVVEYCDTDDDLSAAERFWVDHFRLMGCPLTNHKEGGFNGRPSDETRQKMSAARLGKRNSLESRAKVSAALRGRKQSPEAIENMRQAKLGSKNPMFGKLVSVATRKKRSDSLRGEKNHRHGMPPPSESEATRFKPGHQTWNKGCPGPSGEQHPMFGKHHSEESRQLMSTAKVGQVAWNKGIKMPIEPYLKMRATKQQATHCRRGHLYTASNMVVVPHGRHNAGTRQCLTCRETWFADKVFKGAS